ncbi:MAG TPA: respiratory nitrate reductase subunit gamma [Gammaproteobacteria bacterium]|nr:respiratory nitrate reductase subunit gamma [Gammaproteobacteria bacterium]
MSLLTIAYTLLFYLAGIVLLAGLAWRVRLYARTPTPLHIPTTPAPISTAGVVRRMFFEITLFNSLFKASKWTWLFGWLMHAALLLVLLRHLRYFTEPVWSWVALLQPFGFYAGFAMLSGLGGLWARRLLVDRVRYISSPSDHLMLALLAGIVLTGLGMRYVAPADIVAVKAFFLGLMYFDWQPMPPDWMLNLHLLLVAMLMLVFPFSKLLHAPGMFFSPTRNQADNAREHRHLPTRTSPAVDTRG